MPDKAAKPKARKTPRPLDEAVNGKPTTPRLKPKPKEQRHSPRSFIGVRG